MSLRYCWKVHCTCTPQAARAGTSHTGRPTRACHTAMRSHNLNDEYLLQNKFVSWNKTVEMTVLAKQEYRLRRFQTPAPCSAKIYTSNLSSISKPRCFSW